MNAPWKISLGMDICNPFYISVNDVVFVVSDEVWREQWIKSVSLCKISIGKQEYGENTI